MILLTGATGYIGSNLWIKLLKGSTPVIGIDNLSNSRVDCLEAISSISSKCPTFYEGDVRDSKFLSKIFSKFPITHVIHLAALKDIQTSMIQRGEYFDVNVRGLKNLLSVMRNHGCRKIIFSSSAAVYGQNLISPIMEASNLTPSNYYGETKLLGEELLAQEFYNPFAISSISLRYFNVAGNHSSGLLFDSAVQSSHSLFSEIAKVLGGSKAALSIYGGDWETADGSCIRDYLHVSDLASGHINSLKLLDESDGAFVVNLGLGKGQSVYDVISVFENIVGRVIPKEVTARRAGDVGISYADIHRASNLISWSPTKSLENMCIDNLKSSRINGI